MRGKKVKSKSIIDHIADPFKGCLKYSTESDIRRMTLQMLTKKLLKESFVAMKVGPGFQTQQILVYL